MIATDGVHSFVNCDLLRQAMSEVFQPELLQPADAAVQQAEPTQLGRLVMLSDRSSAAGKHDYRCEQLLDSSATGECGFW